MNKTITWQGLTIIFCCFACNQNPKPIVDNFVTPKEASKVQAAIDSSHIAFPEAIMVEQDTSPGDPTKPHVYLTIDDGPSSYSDEIMEVATEKNAKLTVFLVGQTLWSKKHKDFLTKYRNHNLIELGNHSYSHANNKYAYYYSNPNGVLLDFYKNVVQMQLPNSFARLPGRSFWALGDKESFNQKSGQSAALLLKSKGFQLFGWDVEWFYHHKTGAPKNSAEQVFAEIQRSLRQNETFAKGHCVVLLHERHFQQKYEMAKLITLCQKEGYILDHLKNYPIPKNTTVKPSADKSISKI